jgi:hypothetical protein
VEVRILGPGEAPLTYYELNPPEEEEAPPEGEAGEEDELDRLLRELEEEQLGGEDEEPDELDRPVIDFDDLD